MYDPCHPLKQACKEALRRGLAEIGVTELPIHRNVVNIIVNFHVRNVRKDLDNLLKFIFDVLEDVAYPNDAAVFGVVSNKVPLDDDGSAMECTTVERIGRRRHETV